MEDENKYSNIDALDGKLEEIKRKLNLDEVPIRSSSEEKPEGTKDIDKEESMVKKDDVSGNEQPQSSSGSQESSPGKEGQVEVSKVDDQEKTDENNKVNETASASDDKSSAGSSENVSPDEKLPIFNPDEKSKDISKESNDPKPVVFDDKNNQDEKKNGEHEQFVIFNLAGEEFGISINEVFEITKLKEIIRVPNTEPSIRGVINLRGRIHSVLDLSKKLDLPVKEPDNESRIIIIETRQDNIGIIVDSVKEVLKVNSENIKDVPNMFGTKIDSQYISNVLILGERLVIILDFLKIIKKDDAQMLSDVKSRV